MAVHWNEARTELQTGIFVAQVAPPMVAATSAVARWTLGVGLLLVGLVAGRARRG